MSEINGKYSKIMKELENQIKDPQELEFVKEKFSELSLVFIDIIDRLTNLTDARIKQMEDKQKEILNRMNYVQNTVEGIENDIYGEDENYEFEIVCPYCNYEFTADIEDENKNEIQCPECHNTIELDWNQEEYECSGSCMSCDSHCVAEESEEYDSGMKGTIEDNEELKDNEQRRKNSEDNDDDM